MRMVMVAAGAAVLAAGTPALAQEASDDVNGYLCTFAGKCGGSTTTEATPVMAAPPTKGFRLASSTPTIAAPPTKGFRLATGTQQTAPAPTMAAPQTRSFRVVRTPAPTAQPAPARTVARRNVTPVRPVLTPGASRADLMLTFEYNSDRMTPAAQARARTFAQALLMDELKAKRFLIEGHTDARGSRDANIDLSRRRAQTVADFLVAQGVDRGRVEVKGVGPDEPLPGRAASAEANRRVEAVLLS